MSKILLFIQQDQGKLNQASLAALTAAQEISFKHESAEILGICLGAGAKNVVSEIATYGLANIYYSENSIFDKYIASNYAKACVQIMQKNDCKYLIASATTTGKDFLPLVAVKLSAGQASDITGVNPDKSFRRPVYAGNALADVQITTDKKIITVRGSSFDLAKSVGGSSQLEDFSPDFQPSTSVTVLEYQIPENSRPELTEAKIIVSGGRGVGTSANFEKLIFPLADKLNAAVGASRAVVDAGEVPNDWQVGQTGKIVAPNLYIAIGLSGAIQHLAGMKDSKVIVAINKDAEAPIFEVADYGIVGDLFQIVPELTQKINLL